MTPVIIGIYLTYGPTVVIVYPRTKVHIPHDKQPYWAKVFLPWLLSSYIVKKHAMTASKCKKIGMTLARDGNTLLII